MRKVVENPPRFRGYPHPIKALNACQETLKEYFKVSRNLTQRQLLKAEPRAPEQKTIREHGESESCPMRRAARALKVKPEGDVGGLNDLT